MAATTATIPVIDVAALVACCRAKQRVRDNADAKAVADQIGDACRRTGFFYVKNHGVDEALVARVFGDMAGFFSLPQEEKLKYHISKTPYHRGYSPLFAEVLDGESGKVDLKESFDMGLDLPPTDPEVVARQPFMGCNTWPDAQVAPADFQQTAAAYYAAVWDLARALLRAFAVDLQQSDEDFFVAMVERPLALLRYLHYPIPDPAVAARMIGCGAHTDYGLLTILLQDDIGGLEVKGTADTWISARPIAGTFVVNIGDLTRRFTNDLYTATVHRVALPTSRERYSAPFFCDPHPATLVSTLASCISEEHPAKYDPITCGAWITSRYADTYAYQRERQEEAAAGGGGTKGDRGPE